MKKALRIFALGLSALLILAVGFYALFGSPVRLYRNRLLKDALRQPPAAADEITLNSLIPFAWDAVYTFGPYTGRSQMEAVLGVKDAQLPESIEESQRPLVVMQDGKVAAALCGYADNLGFSVRISIPEGETAAAVQRADCTVFRICRTESYIVYTQLPQTAP